MTATSHALIGTVIASQFSNPYLAIPLALASHIAADMIPHWDEGTHSDKKIKRRIFIESIGDVGLGFALSYTLIFFLFPETNLYYTFLIIIVAQAPDWLMAPYYFFRIKAFRWAYHIGKATNSTLDKPWGIITQIFAVSLLVVLALLF